MSLPANITLPLRVDYQNQEDMDRYLRDLVYELQGMYENITTVSESLFQKKGEMCYRKK